MFLFVSSLSHAGAIVADRPTVGVGTATIPLGQLQIEAGFQLDWEDGTPAQTWQYPTLFRYGITPNMELRMDTGVVSVVTTEGNPQLPGGKMGAKIGLFRSDPLNLSTLLTVPLPVGKGDFAASTGLLCDLSGENISSWVNVGAGYADQQAEFSYVFGLGVGITDFTSSFVETSGATDPGGNAEGTLQTGLVWSMDQVQLDLYGQSSLYDSVVGLRFDTFAMASGFTTIF